MKTTILSLSILLSMFSLYGQESNKLCLQRGHYPEGFITTASMYCEGYIIDTDEETVYVKPSCNTNTYTCGRCKEVISEKEKEVRTVIWKKDSKK